MKKHRKLKISVGVKIAWIWENEINTHNYAYESDHCNHINKFGDFDRETLTHKGTTHAKSKKIKTELPENRAKVLLSSEPA